MQLTGHESSGSSSFAEPGDLDVGTWLGTQVCESLALLAACMRQGRAVSLDVAQILVTSLMWAFALVLMGKTWPCLRQSALKGNILGFDQNLIYILTKKPWRVINEL